MSHNVLLLFHLPSRISPWVGYVERGGGVFNDVAETAVDVADNANHCRPSELDVADTVVDVADNANRAPAPGSMLGCCM